MVLTQKTNMGIQANRIQPINHLSLEQFHIVLLLLIAAVMYWLFHFSEFVTSDEVRYAIGFKELSGKGMEPFNYEMSFGYYLALHPLISLLPNSYWPLFLNGLSSLIGTILLIPLYLLIRSFFDSKIAFLTALFLLFSPPFWLLTRYGHPAVPALLLFICATAALDQSLGGNKKNWLWWGGSILLSVISLTIRVDILLCFLFPVGMSIYKKDKYDRVLPFLLSFYILTFLGYGIIKWAILKYIFNPTGGTIYAHLQERIPNLLFVINSLIKNSSLFLFGFLPILAFCMVLSLLKLIYSNQWKFLVLIGSWIMPTLVFLPFWGMDFSRLSVPILPPLIILVVCWIENLYRSRFPYIFSLSFLLISHLTPILTSPLLTKTYFFKTVYNNRPIAFVPIENIISDYFLRKEYLKRQGQVLQEVTLRKDRNLVIVTDTPHLPWYLYELLLHRHGVFQSVPSANNYLTVFGYQTMPNYLYFWVIDGNSNSAMAIDLFKQKPFRNSQFHINPFMSELRSHSLFLEHDEFIALLIRNPKFMNGSLQIFKSSSSL